MRKVQEAQKILKALGLPIAQQNEMSALTLLALAEVSKSDSWSMATKKSVTVTKGVMNFVAEKYKRDYAPNTRETFRRFVLHQFVQARIADYNPDNPALPTNSPLAHYGLTDAALNVIKTYGTPEWEIEVQNFTKEYGTLAAKYAKERIVQMIPVTLNDGSVLQLSPGGHNEIQAAVVEQFAPRFAPGSVLLYLGDTAKKNLYVNKEKLIELGISVTDHDKLPDLILLDTQKNWLFLIEVVTSHGPMSPKRLVELEAMFSNCKMGKVFVTAFPDFEEFRKHTSGISWETEVWIAENPDHMIHYNGDRFMGPR